MKHLRLVLSLLLAPSMLKSQIGYYPPKKAGVSQKTYDKNIGSLKRLYTTIEGGGTNEAMANYTGNIPYIYYSLGVEKERIFAIWEKSYAIDNWIACTKICYEEGRTHNQVMDEFRSLDSVFTKKWCDRCQIVFDSMTREFKKRRAIKKTSLDSNLIAELKMIMQDDQLYRVTLVLPFDTDEKKALWAKQKILDSVNVVKIKAIIRKCGQYPGLSLVGSQYSTAFFVIQHANQQTQEEYLPILKAAVLKKDLDKYLYKMLVDRIYTNRHNMQLFGSQSYWDEKTEQNIPFPIDNSEEAQKIRTEIESIE